MYQLFEYVDGEWRRFYWSDNLDWILKVQREWPAPTEYLAW